MGGKDLAGGIQYAAECLGPGGELNADLPCSPTAQAFLAGANIRTDDGLVGGGFGLPGQPRAGGDGGTTSEQFTLIVLPVRGLSFELGPQQEVVAAVGD